MPTEPQNPNRRDALKALVLAPAAALTALRLPGQGGELDAERIATGQWTGSGDPKALPPRRCGGFTRWMIRGLRFDFGYEEVSPFRDGVRRRLPTGEVELTLEASMVDDPRGLTFGGGQASVRPESALAVGDELLLADPIWLGGR